MGRRQTLELRLNASKFTLVFLPPGVTLIPASACASSVSWEIRTCSACPRWVLPFAAQGAAQIPTASTGHPTSVSATQDSTEVHWLDARARPSQRPALGKTSSYKFSQSFIEHASKE